MEEAVLEQRVISILKFHKMTGYLAEYVNYMVLFPIMAGNSSYFKPAQVVFVFTFYTLLTFPEKAQNCCLSSE